MNPNNLKPLGNAALKRALVREENYRGRLRSKLLQAGPDALTDIEILEMILFLSIPRHDAKPIARRLLARFGSYVAVVTARSQELSEVAGLTDSSAAAFAIVQVSAARLACGGASKRQTLISWDALVRYLTPSFSWHEEGQFRVLFLDSKNQLIVDEPQSPGATTALLISRELIRRGLELKASAFILAHKEPPGMRKSTQEESQFASQVSEAVKLVSMRFLDQVIFRDGAWRSFRREGLFSI